MRSHEKLGLVCLIHTLDYDEGPGSLEDKATSYLRCLTRKAKTLVSHGVVPVSRLMGKGKTCVDGGCGVHVRWLD